MINVNRVLKVSAVWISIVYALCYAGVAMFIGIRPNFMMYALHVRNSPLGENVLTLTTFITGLIIWNVVVFIAVWLFTTLYNVIKD